MSSQTCGETECVWVLWEPCEGSWSLIYGVFLSKADAIRARDEELDPHVAEIATIMSVRVGRVEPNGWWLRGG